MTPAMIVEAVLLAKAAFDTNEPTDEQMAIRKALTEAKVDKAVASIDASIAAHQDK